MVLNIPFDWLVWVSPTSFLWKLILSQLNSGREGRHIFPRETEQSEQIGKDVNPMARSISLLSARVVSTLR